MKGIMYDLNIKNIVLTKIHLPGTRPMVEYRTDWQIPAIRYPNQVLVKTRLGGICATDLHQIDLSGGQLFKPVLGKKVVFGHTALGTIFDCVASEASMDDSLRLISTNGKIVVVGLGYTKTKKIDWSIQVYKEVNIVGTLGYGMELYEGGVQHAFELAFIFFQRTPNLFTNLVTHRFSIDRYKEAFRCAANKGSNRAIKVSFDFR